MSSSGDHPFSTGQTMDDFVKFLKLYDLIANRTGKSSDASLSNTALPGALANPNYVPPDRSPALYAGYTLPFVIATIFVLLRVYARVVTRRHHLELEDWLVVITQMLAVVYVGFACFGIKNLQWGYIVTDMKFDSLAVGLKVLYVESYIIAVQLLTIRSAIILFLRRLYLQSGSAMTRLCNALFALNLLVCILTIVIWTFSCGTHVSANYDVWKNASTDCGSAKNANFYSTFIMMWIVDAFVYAIPIKLVLGMKGWSLKKKIEVAGLLSLGSLAMAASIARLVLSLKSETVEEAETNRWTVGINTTVCSNLEIELMTIFSCAPAIRVLFPSSTPSTTAVLKEISTGGSSGRRAVHKKMSPGRGVADTADLSETYVSNRMSVGIEPDGEKSEPGSPKRFSLWRVRSEEKEADNDATAVGTRSSHEPQDLEKSTSTG